LKSCGTDSRKFMTWGMNMRRSVLLKCPWMPTTAGACVRVCNGARAFEQAAMAMGKCQS
jgi:hypothetical protein